MVKWYKDRKMTERDCQTHRCRFLDFYLEGLLLKSFKRYNHVVALVCTPVWLQGSERPLWTAEKKSQFNSKTTALQSVQSVEPSTWRHPTSIPHAPISTRGLLVPSVFVPLDQRSGNERSLKSPKISDFRLNLACLPDRHVAKSRRWCFTYAHFHCSKTSQNRACNGTLESR